jgi:hypothetical protein
MGYTDIILSQPPKGNFLKLKEMIGHRVVFLGTHSIEEQPDTMNPGKTRKVATVDFVDLDDGEGGRIQWGALVDKPGVVNKLTGQTNSIMGRIVLGDAKPGQSAPFLLDDHQPEDAAFFMNVWQPANREALAGRAAQTQPGRLNAAVAPPGVTPAYQQQPQYQQPAQAPAPQYASMPGVAPQPAAAAASLANGASQAFSPEAIAAMQAMIARGEITVPQ